MKNQVKIEIETHDGQIHWKHYQFPTWKLTSAWSEGFLKLVTKLLMTGSTNQAKPMPKEPEEQNVLMRSEADSVLENLGVKKKQKRKKLLDRAGPCKDVEEMVRKCLTAG